MMVTRLIIGIAGFVGSHLGRYFLKKYANDTLVGLDNLSTGNMDNIWDYRDNINFMLGNCDDWDYLHLLPKCDEVYILGDNDSKIINLLNHIKGWDCKVLYCSGVKVYGESLHEDGSLEDDELIPKSIKAAGIAGNDRIIKAYSIEENKPVIIIRSCNVYGANQGKGIIPDFIKLAKENKPCGIYGAENVREWLYIDDMIKAIDFCMNTSLSGEVFNIGSGVRKSTEEMFGLIRKEYPNLSQYGVEEKINNVSKSIINCDKLIKLGWNPEMKFDAGIMKTIRWYE